MLAVWARILRGVPGSRLVLKNKPFACEAVRHHYWRAFEEHGVERSRVRAPYYLLLGRGVGRGRWGVGRQQRDMEGGAVAGCGVGGERAGGALRERGAPRLASIARC